MLAHSLPLPSLDSFHLLHSVVTLIEEIYGNQGVTRDLGRKPSESHSCLQIFLVHSLLTGLTVLSTVLGAASVGMGKGMGEVGKVQFAGSFLLLQIKFVLTQGHTYLFTYSLCVGALVV